MKKELMVEKGKNGIGMRCLLTDHLDKELDCGDSEFSHYLYPYNDNILLIRYPGASIGKVVMMDNVITEIKMYEENHITKYKSDMNEILQTYIGFAFIKLCE